MQSPITLVIVIVFLVLGMAVVIVPQAASFTNVQLNNNNTQVREYINDTLANFGYPGVSAKVLLNESLSVGPNPTESEIWYPGTINTYVISVPKGSTFAQYVTPNLQIVNPQKPTVNVFSNWKLQGILYIMYQQYNINSNSYSSSSIVTTYNISSSGSFGIYKIYASITPSSFPVSWNASQLNINSAFGILTFKTVTTFYAQSDGSAWVQGTTGTTFAQIYVVPGTGTINIPRTVLQGQTEYLTGTTYFGNYYLSIYNPSGYDVENVTIPQNMNPFNVSYQLPQNAPTGQYRVVLYNSVVELVETQFFTVNYYHGPGSNNGYLPTPIIKLSAPSNANGSYNPDAVVTYTFIEKGLSQWDTVYFDTYIWIGSQSQEPPSSSAKMLVYNDNFTAIYQNGEFVYTGTFTIPSQASDNYITILVYAYMDNSTGFFASQPAHTTISVNYSPVPGPKPGELYSVLEIIGFVVAGLIVAYVVPGIDILQRFIIFASSLVGPILIYLVNIAHIL